MIPFVEKFKKIIESKAPVSSVNVAAKSAKQKDIKSYISQDQSNQENASRFKKGASSFANDIEVLELPPKVPRKIEFKITTKTGIV